MLPIPAIVTLTSLVAGLLFLGGAVYLQSTRSLALSNLQNPSTVALQAEFNGFKIQTFYPIVALFVIAAVCTIGMPAYYLFNVFHTDDVAIDLKVPVEPDEAIPKTIGMVSETLGSGGDVTLKVFKSETPFTYNISSDRFGGATLEVWYDRATSTLHARQTDRYPAVLLDVPNVTSDSTELEHPVLLQPAKVTAAPTVIEPLSPETTGSKYAKIADPTDLKR
jgi:hypothetical protein